MPKQTFLISSFLLLALAGITRGQVMDRDSVILPQPVGGWEKFDSTIAYLEIHKRAGFEGLILYTFEVDSLGGAALIGIESTCFFCEERSYSLTPDLVVSWRVLFQEFKWVPAKLNGKPINYIFKVPIVYYMRDKSKRAPLIIKEADKPVIRKDY